MTDDDALARRALQAALAGEPPLRIDLPALEQREGLRMRRRRVLVSTAGVVAVLLGSGVGLAVSGRPTEVPSAATPGCSEVVETDDRAVVGLARATPAATAAGTELYQSSSAAPPPTVTGTTASRPLTDDARRFRDQVRSAVVDALPRGSTVVPMSASQDGPEAFEVVYRVTTRGVTSTVTVTAQPADFQVPPCTPEVAERTTAADGLVADVYRPVPQASMLGQAIKPGALLVLVMVDPIEPGPTTITTSEVLAIVADVRVRPPAG